MRDITPSSLVFLAFLPSAACVPAAPRLEGPPPPAAPSADAAPERASAEPVFEPPSRPDAQASARPDAQADATRADAPREGISDAPGEAAVDAPRESARDTAPDASAERAPAERERTARAPRPRELAITELLIDPAGNDLGHEWLELANGTDEALDLSGLHLADDATDVAVDAGVLAPRALLVLGQSADRAHNGDAPVDRPYGTRLAFNNGADRIALCAGPCAEGAVLAVFEWAAAFGAEYVGHAVVVDPDGSTCRAADAYGAAGDFGSPGRANPPCAPPAERRDAAPEVSTDAPST